MTEHLKNNFVSLKIENSYTNAGGNQEKQSYFIFNKKRQVFSFFDTWQDLDLKLEMTPNMTWSPKIDLLERSQDSKKSFTKNLYYHTGRQQ